MARTPKPWFREDRNSWFVTINGQRHNLGPDEKEAKRLFHSLMANPQADVAGRVTHGLSVADVFEKFLDWCEKHRSPATYQFLQYRIQKFISGLERPEMPAADLKPFHVVEWIDKHESWGDTFRRNLITALQRPFNWATKIGYLTENPIRFIEKPAAKRREQVINPKDWEKIRDHYKEGDPFRDLLEFAWETGCRPFEVRKLEVRHVQLSQHRVYFPKEEAKGKKHPRVIYMTSRAEEIVRRLLSLHAEGLVFLNADSEPWTPFAMNCRFCRLKKHLGVKYATYSLRHGFCQKMLEKGIDLMTVATLMGHRDSTMINRVYSHMDSADDHLREKLNGSAEPKVPES